MWAESARIQPTRSRTGPLPDILYDIHTRPVVIIIIDVIFGIGAGMVLTSVNVGTQAISKPGDYTMAANMYGFFRSLGMPLGVSVSQIPHA